MSKPASWVFHKRVGGGEWSKVSRALERFVYADDLRTIVRRLSVGDPFTLLRGERSSVRLLISNVQILDFT